MNRWIICNIIPSASPPAVTPSEESTQSLKLRVYIAEQPQEDPPPPQAPIKPLPPQGMQLLPRPFRMQGERAWRGAQRPQPSKKHTLLGSCWVNLHVQPFHRFEFGQQWANCTFIKIIKHELLQTPACILKRIRQHEGWADKHSTIISAQPRPLPINCKDKSTATNPRAGSV